MDEPIRVAPVDAHRLFRSGIASLMGTLTVIPYCPKPGRTKK
jgi:hypothetical protein